MHALQDIIALQGLRVEMLHAPAMLRMTMVYVVVAVMLNKQAQSTYDHARVHA